MAYHGVSSEQQRRWAEEVLYLHSLWHQNPNPNHHPAKKSRTDAPQPQPQPQPQPSDPPAAEVEWPTNPDPSPARSWPEFARNPSLPPARPPASAADKAKHTASLLQQYAVDYARTFFVRSSSDDTDDDDSDEDDEEKAFEFFLDFFESDEEVRSYYEKNCENGDFCCLVCGGLGLKVGKKYKDCVGLVQHSKTVLKKAIGAHRGFGRAVCRVLGWDVNRLPSIVLDLADPLGKSLAKAAAEMQKENDACAMNNDLQKENSTKETIAIPNKENDTCVMDNDLQKENGIKEPIEKDAASVELTNCMETKELSELAKNSDCTKEKELSKLMASSKDGASGELMNCREANELPKLPTNSNPDPSFCPVASTASTASKKSSRKKKKTKEQMMLQKQSHPPDPLVVENKWPVLSSEPKTKPTGWPEFPLKPLRTPLSMEEQARAAASRLQQNGVRALHNFLKKDDSSNNAGEDDDDGDEREEEAFQFFLGLFERDTGLRIYYEKNYSNGEFYCLVCRGIGVKMGKTYRDCAGIVQHSTSSLKKWRKAHRGFGRAVCRVLGWNIGKLPNIVQDLGDSLDQSLVKPAAPQNDDSDEVMILEHADADAMNQMETKDIIDLSSDGSSEDGKE